MTRIRSSLLGFASVLALSTALIAQETPLPPMSEIEAAWARDDFVFVRENLARHAKETGSAIAQQRYGQVLLEGRGGPIDTVAAAEMLRASADQGNNTAAIQLARLLLTENEAGPARDPEAAVKLFTQAATQGMDEAKYYLGLLYLSGTGVEANPDTAESWLYAAASTGHVPSQLELGMAYAQGKGVAQDGVKAERWLVEAANGGATRAQMVLARIASGADKHEDAFKWFHMAAKAGSARAAREVGLRLLNGVGVAANREQAMGWLQAVAKIGDDSAMMVLGQAAEAAGDMTQAADWYNKAAAYTNEEGLLAMARVERGGLDGRPANVEAAYVHLERALREGSTKVYVPLGVMATAGELDALVSPQAAVPWVLAAASADKEGATEWLSARAKDGVRPAQSGLGLYYLEQGQAADAAPLLRAAAMAGDVPAQAALGQMHVTGTGVAVDYVAAHVWLNVAASLGHVKAVETRNTVTALMTPEEVEKAQGEARAFLAADAARAPQTEQSVVTINPDGTQEGRKP